MNNKQIHFLKIVSLLTISMSLVFLPTTSSIQQVFATTSLKSNKAPLDDSIKGKLQSPIAPPPEDIDGPTAVYFIESLIATIGGFLISEKWGDCKDAMKNAEESKDEYKENPTQENQDQMMKDIGKAVNACRV